MKKAIAVTLAIAAVVTLTTACAIKKKHANATEEGSAEEPAEPPVAQQEREEKDPYALLTGQYTFASGVGGWATELSVLPDGSFFGSYDDVNWCILDGYEWEHETSRFRGNFTDPERVNDYTWSFRLESLRYNKPAGTEETVEAYGEKTLVNYTEAPGLTEGTTFYLYKEGAPVKELPQSFIQWAEGADYGCLDDVSALPFRGLYNVEEEYGFVGDPMEKPEAYTAAMTAYRKYLLSEEPAGDQSFDAGDVESFAFLYLNNDDVPELVTFGGGQMDRVRIFTCRNGKVENVHWASSLDFYSNGVIYASFNGDGYILHSFYRMTEDLELSLLFRYAEWHDQSDYFTVGENAWEEDAPRMVKAEAEEEALSLIAGVYKSDLNTYSVDDEGNWPF